MEIAKPQLRLIAPALRLREIAIFLRFASFISTAKTIMMTLSIPL
jgi:hypothetical protein